MGNVHAISQAVGDPMNFIIIVTFVGREMPHHQIAMAVTPGAPNDQVEQGSLGTLIIRNIGTR
jgi:hypothetical protein